MLFGQFHGGRHGSKINGLKNLAVQRSRFFGLEGITHGDKDIRQTLDPNPDGTMPEIGIAGLGNRVIIDINDPVEVTRNRLGDFKKTLVVKSQIGFDKAGQGNGSQVADRDFVRAGVFHNLGAEVAGLDGAQVLLVALAIASILVEHVRGPGFDLGFQDGKPQVLGLDGFAGPFLFFVA